MSEKKIDYFIMCSVLRRGCYEKFMDFGQVTFLVTDTVVEKVI